MLSNTQNHERNCDEFLQLCLIFIGTTLHQIIVKMRMAPPPLMAYGVKFQLENFVHEFSHALRHYLTELAPGRYSVTAVPEFSRQVSGHNCTKDTGKCYSRKWRSSNCLRAIY